MNISEERFLVTYLILGDKKSAYEKADDICLEQTVEFPRQLVPEGFIRDEIIGRIESFEPAGANQFKAVISYAQETTAGDFAQFLNVIFGNISIKKGIKISDINLPDSILKNFKGPRFGITGLRNLTGIENDPLLCTALKPMGLSAGELAELAYQCALGGIDFIKDDHGLTNQPSAPFKERVSLCARAVTKANYKTGKKCIYIANITASFDEITGRALFAKEAGAGGLMISPGITGLDAMKYIAGRNDIALPVFTHPAFQGSFVMGDNFGISHGVLFGQLARLAGADASIYPNYGGRFPFTREECDDIKNGCYKKMGDIKRVFPCPGGGMNLDRVSELLEFYDKDVIFLIGAGLFTHSPDFIENCRYFKQLVRPNLTTA